MRLAITAAEAAGRSMPNHVVDGAIPLQIEAVIARWTREIARELPELGVTGLVAPMREVIAAVVGCCYQREVTQRAREAVEAAAIARLHGGTTVRSLLCEYACLRRCLHVELDGDVASAAIDDVIDGAMTHAVGQYCDRREETRERFVAILAHDLRAPLSVILMGAEVLQLEPLESRDRRWADRIRNAANRMGTMVTDLLAFARAHLGDGIPITPRADDLGAVVAAVVAEARAFHGDDAITLRLVGDLRAHLDPQRAHQAISNLVRNALEHGAGIVHVSVEEAIERNELVLAVRNAGSIAPSALASGSGAFPRTRRSTQRGLGLYIVDEVVRAHGARLQLASTSSDTTFTVAWPKASRER